MVALGWTVLALVFLDDLLAVAALGVYGWSASPRWLLVWLLPLLTVLAGDLLARGQRARDAPVDPPVGPSGTGGDSARQDLTPPPLALTCDKRLRQQRLAAWCRAASPSGWIYCPARAAIAGLTASKSSSPRT